MDKVKGAAVIRLMREGRILEYGERHYRYDSVKNEVQYSDYNKNNWKKSTVKIDDYLVSNIMYNVVPDGN